MARHPIFPDAMARKLRWPLGLTRAGMIAERALKAFWPLITVLMLALAALMFGLQDSLPLELAWGVAALVLLAGLVALVHGVRRFRWPTRDQALERLDRTMQGRPIAAILDQQALGAGDEASRAVWTAHVDRMAARAAQARAVQPDLRLSSRDPFALRYVGALAFVMAVLFGSLLQVATVADLGAGAGRAVAAGPAWEGWVQPPAHTAKPSIYLADIEGEGLAVPSGSRISLRLYGEVGALSVTETVSAQGGEANDAPAQDFDVARTGTLTIEGANGRSWQIEAIADEAPRVRADGEVERGTDGEMRLPFAAEDDYGVVAGAARIELDLPAVDRRHGLTVAPEPRDPVLLDLPMPITGDRSVFTEMLIENLAQHPWATLPVRVTLSVEDAAGQSGASDSLQVILPGRRFFDPLAHALIEQRRDLLWSRENGARVAQVLRAVSYRPDDIFDSSTAYLMLRVAIRRLEMGVEYGQLSEDRRDEIAQALWDIATLIEDGNLSDALERLRRAQDRLSEAMRQGANDQEIAELMQELREAMQDYMRQLAEQGQQDPNQQAQNQDMQEITGDQLQEMLNRLQELMEQGRMAEAQQLLDMLRQMMENMQVTQGQQGQGQQSPGEQAMQGLAETLREQQGLSDETFDDLQQQFNQQGQQGQQGQQQGQRGDQGQEGNDGQQGQQGQGQQGQDGDQGRGQGQPRRGDGRENGGQPGSGLADRQQALRDQLNGQAQNLPGLGTPEGDAAREALDRAGRAMDGAEQALRDQDNAGALDQQAEAMEALRDGMRKLNEQMAQQQQQSGQQGEAFGRNQNRDNRDPLGREAGDGGRIGTDEQLLQGEDVYRRARDLLDEIRRRSGDQSRPDAELDYLRRLLDRF